MNGICLGCKQWYSFSKADQSLARYGHSAVATADNIYVLGGFNGRMLNDVQKFTTGMFQISILSLCFSSYISLASFTGQKTVKNKTGIGQLQYADNIFTKPGILQNNVHQEKNSRHSEPFFEVWQQGSSLSESIAVCYQSQRHL